MAGKTLKSVLKGLKEDTIVKIGTEDGSNFVYVGKPHNYEEIEKVFDAAFEAKKKAMDRLWITISRQVLYNPKTDEDSIINYASALANNFNAWSKGKIFLKKYKKVMRRGVLKMFESSIPEEKGVIVLMITGSELGKYWTVSEKGL